MTKQTKQASGGAAMMSTTNAERLAPAGVRVTLATGAIAIVAGLFMIARAVLYCQHG